MEETVTIARADLDKVVVLAVIGINDLSDPHILLKNAHILLAHELHSDEAAEALHRAMDLSPTFRSREEGEAVAAAEDAVTA